MGEASSASRLRRAMALVGTGVDGTDHRPRLPPPVDLGDEVVTARGMVAEAFAQGADPRRLGWALLRVAELLLASMEEQRILEDDRPDIALMGWRDWCLGGEPARLYEAYNLTTLATAAARDRSHPLFLGCMGIEQLALAARGVQMRATSEDMVRLAFDAAVFGLDLRETYDVSTARAEGALRHGLTEAGPAFADGTRRNPGDEGGPRAHRRAVVIASEVPGDGPGLRRWRFSVESLRGAYAYLEYGSSDSVASYLLASGLVAEARCVRGVESAVVGYLSAIEVPTPHHGQGFGTAMMEEVLKTARESGVEWVFLDALPTGPATRDALVRFYERFGFSVRSGCGEAMPFMALRIHPTGHRGSAHP